MFYGFTRHAEWSTESDTHEKAIGELIAKLIAFHDITTNSRKFCGDCRHDTGLVITIQRQNKKCWIDAGHGPHLDWHVIHDCSF